jgi:type III secretion protein L
MAVWFRDGPCAVGFENGLIKAADFAQLTSFLHVNATMHAKAEALLHEAGAQAEQLLAQAQSQAEALLEDARAQQKDGFARGFEKGHHDGLQTWTTRALEDAAKGQRALDKQRDRLGGLVAMAVERVVEQEDKQALFQRALRSVGKLLQEVPLLTLRVHQSDRDTARRAVDAVLAGVAGGAQIEVVSDTRLESGSCLFESDQGVIDAGLQTQLAAIKRAAVKAARRGAVDLADEAEPADDDAPLRTDAPALDAAVENSGG